MRFSVTTACLILTIAVAQAREAGDAVQPAAPPATAASTAEKTPQEELEALLNGRWELDPEAMADYGPYRASLDAATPEQQEEYMALLRSMKIDLTVMGPRMSLINHHDGRMIREVHRWRLVSQDTDGSYNVLRITNKDERPMSLELLGDRLVYDLGKPLVFKRAPDLPLGEPDPAGDDTATGESP